MADRTPHALEMRDLKYGNRPAEEKDAVAASLRAAGRHAEALLLYDGRPEHPFVAEEARHAVANGLSFLLLQVRRLGAQVSESMLRECAANAERLGRFTDARQCYQAVGDREALVRISPNLPPSLATQPEPPAPTPAP